MKPVKYDEIAIRSLMDDVLAYFNKADFEKLLSLHTEDIILMETDMPLIKGKQKIRALIAALKAKKISLHLSFNIDELEVMGERAFVRGQVFKTVIQEDSISGDIGKFICLLQKQPEGNWLRTHVIVNSDSPAEVKSAATCKTISLGMYDRVWRD
jgi:uncharacterized protein (TIGR02246 family)